MPLKPIDLQTLFMQMSQVNKDRVAEKEGAIIQQSVQGAVTTKKAEEKAQSVQQTKETGEGGMEAVKEKKSHAKGEGEEREGREEAPPEGGKPEVEIIKDPALGSHIDISG
jgi:hypothetical protein